MNNKYKIVFIDIDGTLVNDEKVIPKENIETIKRLKKDRVEVVLASGRPYHSIEKYSNIVGARPYIIGSNGGVVVNFEDNKILYNANIDKSLALEVLSNLSLEELQELLEVSSENYVHTSEEMLVRGTHKQLVLK